MRLNNRAIETFESAILVGMVNMKLRNEFSSLDQFVNYFEIDKTLLLSKLEKDGHIYMASVNQFR